MRFFSLICMSILCCMTLLNANSMHLHNNSSFFLNAAILSADGSQLDNVPMQPQQRRTWYRQSVVNPNTSITPFTVVWTCRNGSEFGVSYQVAVGGLATSLSSTGVRYCKPEKKKSQDDRSRYNEEYRQIIPEDPYAEDSDLHQ